MTKKEIILETVEYYKTHSRGSIGSSCVYYDEGKVCAVGRCMENPEKFASVVGGVQELVEDELDLEDLDEVLKEKYRGHSIYFWEMLQYFHDKESNWREVEKGNVLTENGERELKTLLDRYDKN